MSGFFLDTNVIVYAFSDDPRRVRAAELLGDRPIVSVQNLNEFASVARRKLKIPWDEVSDALALIESSCARILPLTLELHHLGVEAASRFGLGIYDAMIVAAALETGCDRLYSEDMHHGLVIDGRVSIENPFRVQDPR